MLLREVVAQNPRTADARRLLGVALRDLGDAVGAERELSAALALAPTSAPAAVVFSELMMALGRPEEAMAAVDRLAARPGADIYVLTAHAVALKALGRLEDAAASYRRAIQAAPTSAVAEHNLASVLGDMNRLAESEASARRAFAKGLDAPETWLVLARALFGQSRYVEAQSAYSEAIRRRPNYVEAHGELAQLIWMQTADAKAATAALDQAIAAYPNLQALSLKKAELLDHAGERESAYAAIAGVAGRSDAEAPVHVVAARLLMRHDPQRALHQARLAIGKTGEDPIALSNLCEAYLAVGDIDEAAKIATTLHERDRLNQHSLGLLATVWRLSGDPRYKTLADYDRLVGSQFIDTPSGWESLGAYLADLRGSLERLHTLHTHPVGQSLRHGSQTSQDLTRSDDPTIQAFFQAIDGPIRRHIERLGAGDDPVRSRRSAGYAFAGVWSVRLRPHGFHVDHLHPKGWLSSACYIALPQAVDRGHEGWLQFGQPGVPTNPPLAAEHFVKPEPGLLALFPSYMWHGTVPFSGDESRLTIAFDVIPA